VVSFDKNQNGFTNVFLKGPAEFVFKGTIEI
jgi:diaminopimelate epimerase